MIKLFARVQPGYYPGYSTLDQKMFWDETTRDLILKRVYEVPPIRFFTETEAKTMQSVLGRILPQEDRIESRRISLLNYIDERLYSKRGEGYRYEDMPEDDEAHRLGIRAIEIMSTDRYGRCFTELSSLDQDTVLKSIHDGQPFSAQSIWNVMSVQHYWSLLLRDAVAAYYAHPWAWDEIGFGGPAYPRGYMRTTGGEREPWEVNEKRYEWSSQPDSLSDF